MDSIVFLLSRFDSFAILQIILPTMSFCFFWIGVRQSDFPTRLLSVPFSYALFSGTRIFACTFHTSLLARPRNESAT